MPVDLTAAYLRWTLLRAALARGWWLAAALYLVVVADLSPSQLVMIGVFQGLIVVVAEVPAGVLADAMSRRLALVVAHVVMGAGMAMTGFVTAFPLLVVSQCLWGLGWAIASGADVAWITDELDRPDLIDRVLTAQGRFDLIGTAVGIVVFGTLAWATTLVGGDRGRRRVDDRARPGRRGEMARVPAPVRHRRATLGTASVAVLRPGRRRRPRRPDDRPGAREHVARQRRRGRLRSTVRTAPHRAGHARARQIRSCGSPHVALVAAALGATTLLFVEARIAGVGVARRTYVAACGIGTVGLVVFAQAPDAAAAVAGALLVKGIAFPTVRVAGTILVNRRTPSEARATVHSLLSLVGEPRARSSADSRSPPSRAPRPPP